MDTIGNVDIPTSLSAVFDSSDEEDHAAPEAPKPTLYREFEGLAQPKGDLDTSAAAAIVTPELLRLADVYREAGVRLC